MRSLLEPPLGQTEASSSRPPQALVHPLPVPALREATIAGTIAPSCYVVMGKARSGCVCFPTCCAQLNAWN